MKTKTPKAWYVGRTGDHQGAVVEEGTGRTIAVAYDKADAALLAAAPRLLAAARAMVAALRGGDPQYSMNAEEGAALNALNAAISDAEEIPS